MTTQDAHRLVTASIVVMLVFGIAGRTSTQQFPLYKRLWAIGALSLILSLLADFLPQVGGPLALLFALGFVAGGQARITGILSNAVGGTAGAAASPPPAAASP